MAEKIEVMGLVREKDYQYYVSDGAVWKIPRKKRGTPTGEAESIADGDFEMDTNYIYFLDAEGDVSRQERALPPRRATMRKRKSAAGTTRGGADEYADNVKVNAGDHIDVDTSSNPARDRASLLSVADNEDAPTIFSFGYEGCGMGTARFVAAVDAIERARGFEPPLWVDARISRKVRALGFRERALEHLVGAPRYQWMSDLGNEGILNGGQMRIRRPAAVSELLARALDAPRRRVIFFCACSGSSADCHRHEVGRLLLRHARKTGARVRLVEWPGGEPVTLVFQVGSTAELGRKTLDTEGRLREEEAAAVPWGSHGILRLEGYDPEHVLLGPALFGEKQTVLRIAEHLGADVPADPMAIARKWREAHATEAVTVDGDGS